MSLRGHRPPTHKVRQLKGITELQIAQGIQLNRQDMLLTHALAKQPMLEKRMQQEGFSAPSQPSDDLDLTVPLMGNQLIEITRPLDNHPTFSFIEK